MTAPVPSARDLAGMESTVRLLEAVHADDWEAGQIALYGCDPIPTIMTLIGLVKSAAEQQGHTISDLIEGLRAQIPGGAE